MKRNIKRTWNEFNKFGHNMKQKMRTVLLRTRAKRKKRKRKSEQSVNFVVLNDNKGRKSVRDHDFFGVVTLTKQQSQDEDEGLP
jgi:plasmid rolling circle replication initiator protein Rep